MTRLLLPLLALAACDAAPSAAPSTPKAGESPAGAVTLFAAAPYDPPEPEAARQAYRAALGASIAAPPSLASTEPPAGDEDYLSAMARGIRIERVGMIEENNSTIRRSMASLALVEPRDCRWSAFDASDLAPPPPGKGPYPMHAYHCQIRVEHDSERRGRVMADTAGSFFRDADGWVYVGGAAHGFKTAREKEFGL